MRPVVRTLIAVLIAGSCAVLSATAVLASTTVLAATTASAGRLQPSPGTTLADSHALTISIDSVSPQYATSTRTVTLSGTLSNHTGSAIPDIAVQLQTYPSAFATRSDMAGYAGGGAVTLQTGTVTLQPAGTPDQLSAPLANGASTRWSVSFTPGQDFYAEYGVTPGFGVYPLQVEAASTASAHVATARTLLPYWPGSSGTVKPLQVAWIWPLAAPPQQGACAQVLATTSLAGSVAAGGRLARLLAAGAQWSARDDLTWAIDPALLSDVTVMTHPYFTGGDSSCTGRTAHPVASAAAAGWLSALKTDTAGAPAFATPYADVDVSALSHAGLYTNLRTAFQVGHAVAASLLPGTFGGSGGADGQALAAAWPAGGTADAGVLTRLATDGGIRTVVLSSSEMATSAPDYDNAPARATTSAGRTMSVLLADSAITGILSSTTARSPVAARFAATQDFLAQTAMILAEAPNLSRSLVVAPPAGWNPSAVEAADLLRLTRSAPWLRPTGLATLAGQAATAPVRKLRAQQVSSAELPPDYTDAVRTLTASLNQYRYLLSRPSAASLSSLQAAVAVTESAAWRGRGGPSGALALTKLSDFLSNLEGQVKIIASRKLLLAGTSGTTPVSVTNGLDTPVEVLVRATTPAGSPLRVGSGTFEHLLTVNAHMTQTLRLPMSWNSSSIGTTTLRIQLLTRNGIPLTSPAASASMSVEITRFGRTLLVIIAGALGVLVLTAVIRLRRKRRAAGRPGSGPGRQAAGHAESTAHAGGAG